jgi:hypothetical protein
VVKIIAKNHQELKEKFLSVNIDKIVESILKNIKPFEEKERLIWIDQIKEALILVNEDYEEKKVNENVKSLIEEEPKEEEEDNLPNISREDLIQIYELIIKVLKRYVDLDERYYSLIAIWIIGTYFHYQFPTYPYLFFNAMRGSGKSRLLRLISYLSKDGSMLNSLTEAVLFRTTGTLAIDEFEGITKKGKEALLELLNSAYKKGITVKRMRKVKNLDGETQEVEEFEVFRPILMANISGMDNVLGDRCFIIILNKSNKPHITKRIELYEMDEDIKKIKEFPYKRCRWCRVDSVLNQYNLYLDDRFIIDTTDISSLHTLQTLPTLSSTQEKYLPFFNKIIETGMDGRHLELSIPLLIIADFLGNEVFNELVDTLKFLVEEKKSDDIVENLDISLIDYISQLPESDKWITLKELTNDFKNTINNDDGWLNEKWLSRALKRLNLIKQKKRFNYGRCVVLNYAVAQEKIKMFK